MEDRFLVDILEDGSSMLLEHLDMNYGPPSWMSFVPLTDDQMANRHQVGHSQGLAWNRRQALQSALSVASQLLGGMKECREMARETANSEEQRNIPSLEFLYWMLNDLCSDKFGSFVLDFFRHIGKHTLKHMGLSILFNTATSCDSILYTVCVNSVAYKFLNTVSGTERDYNLTRGLQHRALLYRETAITALKKIPLMTKPSLSLLQALLCGIFLQQGAGDTDVCWELTKTACRVCMDIGLHPAGCSEEEYYCFMWCYVLDRNYAWKLGKPRILAIEPNTDMGPPTSNTVASELILIYLDLAKVQDRMIPFLKDSAKADRNAFQSFHGVGTHVLREMESIQRNIDQIKLPSTNWAGLDFHHEIATLDFAYHSIMTCILHLHLATPDQKAADNYLGSARSELLALIAICASTDTQKTAAYLHWTLLYYPLTAYFTVFCNAVATCHAGDFQILKALANCLAESGAISQPIATMHNLFEQFVSLSWCFFSEENTSISAADECVVQPQSSSHHWGGIAGSSSPLSLPSWMESALSQELLTTPTVRQAFEPTTTSSALENALCCDDPTFSLQISANDPV
ncbi:fungal specific transcription factor domain-containing protein [Aspergillus ruber CBS 135680]|uniref:Xylanolytic transcriptional activator regulatory domain-containing protein n=1 Tax=Aspergillus ruber (strain CBS 135680) TaxID=1388766 RepID=A0A017S4A8_ASPRC|nr:uncharacterized protein EURHEDRAFT_463784 [Aspergillus ruber CBS 135680]EYE91868.1 hypothetical protein EURHEDRAFT_463784 [Aspergillus ruber CBS 135680]